MTTRQRLDRAIAALKAARPYVETCADDELPNAAADALKMIDNVLTPNISRRAKK